MSVGSDGWEFFVGLTNLYRDMMQATVEQTGMSKTRLEILDVLADVDEMSQADLQRHLGVEGPVVTRIVKQLEAEGLVTRRPDPRDNRYTLVALKPSLREMRTEDALMKFKEAFGTLVMEGFSDEERALLLRSLKQIQKNVQAHRETLEAQAPKGYIDRLQGSTKKLRR